LGNTIYHLGRETRSGAGVSEVVILDRARHSAIMVALDASNGDIHRVQNLCAEIDYLAISLKISFVHLNLSKMSIDIPDLLVGLGGFCLRLFEFIDVY
jgi:hypothetical protein